jgi:hypothetical protein
VRNLALILLIFLILFLLLLLLFIRAPLKWANEKVKEKAKENEKEWNAIPLTFSPSHLLTTSRAPLPSLNQPHDL